MICSLSIAWGCGEAPPPRARTPEPAPSASADDQATPDLLTLVPERVESLVVVHFDRLRTAGLLEAATPWLLQLGVPAARPLVDALDRLLEDLPPDDDEPDLLILEHRPPSGAPLRTGAGRPEWGEGFAAGPRVYVSVRGALAAAARAQAAAPSLSSAGAERIRTFAGDGRDALTELTTTGPLQWPAGLAGLGTAETPRLVVRIVATDTTTLRLRAEYASDGAAAAAERVCSGESAPAPVSLRLARRGRVIDVTATAPGAALFAWLGGVAP